MPDLTIGRAKRTRIISLWTLMFAVVMCLTASLPAACAVSVTNVRIINQPDRVEIYAAVDGSVKAQCSQSVVGKWIALDIEAAYQGKPLRKPIYNTLVHAVRAGRFKNTPPVTRIAITTSGKVPYEMDKSDNRVVHLIVWKSKALQQAAQARDTAAPVNDKKVKPSASTPVKTTDSALANKIDKPCEEPSSSPVELAVVAPTLKTMTAEAPKPAVDIASAQPIRPKPILTAVRPMVKPPVRAEKSPAKLAEPGEAMPAKTIRASATPQESTKVEPVTKVAGATEVIDSTHYKTGDIVALRPTSSANTEAMDAASTNDKRVLVAKNASISDALSLSGRRQGLVSLNFVGSDINDVFKALTMQANANIVTATDVKGQVTVSMKDVPYEQALDSIAKLSGYKWTKDGNTYYVATDKSLSNFKSANDNRVETVAFNRGSAKDMLAILKAQASGVTVTVPGDPNSAKQLILQGSSDEVESAKLMIAKVDSSMSPVKADTAVEVYNIKYSSAASLIGILQTLAPMVNVSAGALQPQFKMEPGDSDKVKILYKKTGLISGGSSASPGGAEAAGGGQPAGPQQGAGGAGGQGSISESRMLVITGRAEDVEAAKEILAKVDVRTPQVLIEAKLVDLDVTDAKSLGFTYDQTVNGFNIGVTGTKAGVTTTKDYTGFLKASLDAEITEGKVDVLAHPRISVLDGQPATIFIGDEITYVQSIQATPSGNTVTTDTKKAGIELGCIPLVSKEDGTITLMVHPEVATLKLVESGGFTLPQVFRRIADSTIRLKDGQTVVIGGLISKNEIDTLVRIPFLSELPFFGQLFRHRDKSVDNRDLVIFITCSLMKES